MRRGMHEISICHYLIFPDGYHKFSEALCERGISMRYPRIIYFMSIDGYDYFSEALCERGISMRYPNTQDLYS